MNLKLYFVHRIQQPISKTRIFNESFDQLEQDLQKNLLILRVQNTQIDEKIEFVLFEKQSHDLRFVKV